MEYIVTYATERDLPSIYQLFEEAIRFQQAHHYVGWKSFDKHFIQADVRQKLLWKISKENSIACIFSICLQDPLIWREMEKGDALYLHRVVLNRQFSGEKLFARVLAWARQYAAEHALKYIRMDTWAANEKIIQYYQGYGFRFVENYKTADTDDLPLQHRNLEVALLELNLFAA